MAEPVSRDLFSGTNGDRKNIYILIQLATSNVCTPSPEEELRVFERCYIKNISLIAKYVEETHGDRSTTQNTKVIATRLNMGGYIIRDIMTL